MLTRDEAKAFYDRFGAKQDGQAFYEDCAIDDLLLHGGFEEAEAVYELGCGTGRFAEKLFRDHLGADAEYHGTDLSGTMVTLASERLAPYADRVRLDETDGRIEIDEPQASLDRVVSTYVLDLLSEEDIAAFLDEALRTLRWNGRLCLAGLCPGPTFGTKIISTVWSLVHRLRPVTVGGCRPLELGRRLENDPNWELRHRRVLVAYGLASEVVIATPNPDRIESASKTAGVA